MADWLKAARTAFGTAGDWLIFIFFFSALVLPGAGELVFAAAVLYGAALTLQDLSRGRLKELAHPRPLLLVLGLLSTLSVSKYLSVLWSIDTNLSLRDSATHSHFLLAYPLWRALSTARTPARAFWAGSAAGILVVAGWGLLWVWGPLNLHRRDFEAGAQNPMVLRMLVALQLTWWVCAVAIPRSRSTIGWVALGASMVALLAAGGRSPVLAVLFALVLWQMARWWGERPKEGIYSWVGFTAVLLLLLVQVNGADFVLAWQELETYTATANVATSTGNRLELINIAIRSIADAPWLGHGAGTTKALADLYSNNAESMLTARHFHNQYLQILTETGLVGAALAVVACGLLLKEMVLVPLRRNHPAWSWSLVFFAVFGASALFSSIFKQGLVNAYAVFTIVTLLMWVCESNPERSP